MRLQVNNLGGVAEPTKGHVERCLNVVERVWLPISDESHGLRVIFAKLAIRDRSSRTPMMIGHTVDVCSIENREPAMPEVGSSTNTAASGEERLHARPLPDFTAGDQRCRGVSKFHNRNGVLSCSQSRRYYASRQTSAYDTD